MDLKEYRQSDSEQRRTEDLVKLIPSSPGRALDVGARDGHFSRILADKYSSVIALDLEKPCLAIENVECVKGDVTSLYFGDDYFDFVLCAEVLEHIPKRLLDKACRELSRVSKKYLLIGVPYMQDIRVGRTTCCSCGKKNPPWGHVNTFNKSRIIRLFPEFDVEQVSFVGETREATNPISTLLLDLAGNPYGTYNQEEACIYCGSRLKQPPKRNFLMKIFTKMAYYICRVQSLLVKKHPFWIHVLFKKKTS